MALHEWHDFFIVAGTSAATLLGLLFVAVTLNADLILVGTRPQLKRVAEQAFQNYISVVLTALLFLFPRQTWAVLATEQLVLGVAMSALVVYRIIVSARRVIDSDFSRLRTLKRLLPSLLGNLILVYSGWSSINAYDESSVQMFALATVILVVAATAISWDLLLRVAEIRHRTQPPT